MRAHFEVEIDGLAELKAAVVKAQAEIGIQAELAMWESVRFLEAEAKDRVPVKTGRLLASIDSRVSPIGGSIIGEVGTNVDYARPIEFGQTAHFITGRAISPLTGKPKLLKFEIGGQTIFRTWVFHPGARAYEFLGGALDASTDFIVDRFKKIRDRTIDILKG